MQHIATSVCLCGNHACRHYKVPFPTCSTSVEAHHSCHKKVSSILQQCTEDDLLLVAIDTHNITIHTIRRSLKESCLKINVKNVPILAVCHLATHPKSRSCGSRRICLLIFLLFVLETSQYPSCLRLEEVTFFLSVLMENTHLPVT